MQTAFHARVIAARLGADGIVTQLQGSLDGPYPLGDISVWVTESDAEAASELLMADEVESAFDLPDEREPWERARRPFVLGLTKTQLLAAFGIAVLVWSAAVARIIA